MENKPINMSVNMPVYFSINCDTEIPNIDVTIDLEKLKADLRVIVIEALNDLKNDSLEIEYEEEKE